MSPVVQPVVIDVGDKLTLRSWDKALAGARAYTARGWSARTLTSGLLIDLSRVGWIEPAAVVRAVLFVESALVASSAVTIRLPRPTATASEHSILQAVPTAGEELRKRASYVARYIDRRRSARAVLERMHLRAVLAFTHTPGLNSGLEIVGEHDWTTRSSTDVQPADGSENAKSDARESKPPWYFEVVYGLQWITDPRTTDGREELQRLGDLPLLERIITHPSGRISAADSKTLAHVFLKELVENSIDHSERPAALVAAWSRPREVQLKNEEVLDCEKPFASWCRGYPLIELAIGDSGRGIPDTLREEWHRHGAPTIAEVSDRSDDDRIVMWAFDKWSSRNPSLKPRGTRGLYRAERVVRKYEGSISLRCERSFVGIESGGQRFSVMVPAHRLPRVPGTVSHVRLPVMLADDSLTRRRSVPLRRASMSVRSLPSLPWSDQGAALEGVTRAIQSAAAEWIDRSVPLVCVLDFCHVQIDRRMLERLLEHVTEVSHPVAVVVANIAGPPWDSCVQTIDSVNERPPTGETGYSVEGADAVYVSDAALFLHSDGRAAWVGGRGELRGLLDDLLIWEEVSLEALRQKRPNSEERNQLLRYWTEAYHLGTFDATSESLKLHFNVADVHESLRSALSARMQSVLHRRDTPGVEDGLFRLPSLRVVGKRVDLEKVLAAQHLRDANVIALARLVASTLDGTANVAVLADWRENTILLESFRRELQTALRLRSEDGRWQEQAVAEVLQIGPSELPVVPVESQIVVFSDMLLSGELVLRLTRQAFRAKHLPRLVASLLDARIDSTDIQVARRRVPVVALTRIDLSPKPDDQRVPTDLRPLDLKPEVDSQTTEEDPIAPAHLEAMIVEQDALHFAHIARSNGRHFTFYLDGIQLLGSLDTADPSDFSFAGTTILQRYIDAIDEWLIDGPQPRHVWFPHFPQSERPSPAELIAAKIARHYGASIEAVGPAGETTFSEAYAAASQPGEPDSAIPPLLELAGSVRTVVIVDWGALTGRSLRGLIRRAANEGAQRVLVVVFLSQLPEDEERSLVQTVAVRGENGPASAPCAVTVEFLSRFPVRAYDGLRCPHCRQLRRLDEEQRALPSDLLRSFANHARNRLRAKRLTDIRQEALNRRRSRIDTPDRLLPTEISNLRASIDRARGSTRERSALHERLLDSAQHRLHRCLLSLLGAEWTLLQEEPLSSTLFRNAIAEVALRAALDASAGNTQRRDAIVVLRTSSKERFTQALSELFAAVSSDQDLAAQLLYCVFTQLQRDYVVPEAVQFTHESLVKCRDHARLEIGKSIAPTVVQALNASLIFANYALHQASADRTARSGWRYLHEWAALYHAHHPVAEAVVGLKLDSLRTELLDPASTVSYNWRPLRQEWEYAEVQIAEYLSHLSFIVPVIKALQAAGVASAAEAEALAEAASERGLERLSAITTGLDHFVAQPQAVRRPGAFDQLMHDGEWLWSHVFKAGSLVEDRRQGGSPLLRLLQGCPTDIAVIFDEVLRTLGDAYDVTHDSSLLGGESLVFCHEGILRGYVRELFKNLRHVRKTDGAKIAVSTSLSRRDRHVILRWSNDGDPTVADGERRGLQSFREYIRPFGGDVKTSPTDGWTVELLVEPW